MREFIVKCDACEKEMTFTEEQLENKTPIVYHQIRLNFRSFMKDPNTNQEEEISNMAKQTDSVYCNSCFMILTKHLESFIDETDPKTNNELLRSVIDKDVAKNQSLEIDGLEALALRKS